jgi:deazaflavin-dependent oxidoreductase (nitroreductase family)
MSTDTMPQPTRAPLFVRLPEPVVRRLLARGLPFGPNVLLTVRGRKSGQPRTFPVGLLTYDGRRYVQSPFGAVNWVHNLRADGRATVSKGGSAEDVVAVELTAAEAGPVLRAVLTPYLSLPVVGRLISRYFGIRAAEDDAAFIAQASRQPIFELRPSS